MPPEEQPFDGTFYDNYKAIWHRTFFGKVLPLPDDVARAVASAVAGGWLADRALVNAFKVAPGESTLFWYRTLPKRSTSSLSGLKAREEVRAISLAGFVVAYGGLLFGVAIVAAYETYGARAQSMLAPLAREVENATGRRFSWSLEQLLKSANLPGAAFLKAMDVGRAVSSPKLYRRGGASGGW